MTPPPPRLCHGEQYQLQLNRTRIELLVSPEPLGLEVALIASHHKLLGLESRRVSPLISRHFKATLNVRRRKVCLSDTGVFGPPVIEPWY